MKALVEILPLFNGNAFHVGDGEKLLIGADAIKDGKRLYTIDCNKLVERIHLFKNKNEVDEQVLDRFENLMLKRKVSDLLREVEEYSDISLRFSSIWGILQAKDVKTHIRDAWGHPYVPGSSIKGAIRTAVLAKLALAQREKTGTIQNESGFERKMFLTDPSDVATDFFKFLRVSDAYYNQKDVVIVQMLGLNDPAHHIRNALEVIAPCENSVSEFNLSVDEDKLNLFCNNAIPTHLDFLFSPKSLFDAVNKYTERQLKRDLQYIQTVAAKDPDIDGYVAAVEDVLEDCNDCGSGECILRLGMGIGKEFTTGLWAKHAKGCAPAITRSYYECDNEVRLLGFVKLRIKSVKQEGQ